MTKDEALKLAIEAAYLSGFNASGEGYNGEYPFGDRSERPEQDNNWCAERDYFIKQALAAPVQEQMEWKNAAIRLGEELSSVGPDGYYDMTAEQWLDWAMNQQPRGKNSLPEAQRWAVFCGGCRKQWSVPYQHPGKSICTKCEAKLKELNT